MKGKLAEVEHRCFRCCAGFAFNKCKTVDSKTFRRAISHAQVTIIVHVIGSFHVM